MPGWVSEDTFLAGYGAAQAVPGPLFTFPAYLGTLIAMSPDGVEGAIVSLIAGTLPSLLLLLGALPFSPQFRRYTSAQAIMRGVNASVVGLLGAALYDPLWVSAVHAPADVGIALLGFLLLAFWKLQPWIIVLLLAGIGALAASF